MIREGLEERDDGVFLRIRKAEPAHFPGVDVGLHLGRGKASDIPGIIEVDDRLEALERSVMGIDL